MKKRHLQYVLILAISVILASCAQPSAPVQPVSQTEGGTEAMEPADEAAPAQAIQKTLSEDAKELLGRQSRIKSISYKYKGPETSDNFYDFYIKEDKIKYLPWLAVKSLDNKDSYDSIFLDTKARTAASYCIVNTCLYKGKKADLNYGQSYISTIFDWTDDLESAEKIGEELIDDRAAWKFETNKGMIWLDTFYGIPLKVESNGNIYRFQHISANGVLDSDVVPS